MQEHDDRTETVLDRTLGFIDEERLRPWLLRLRAAAMVVVILGAWALALVIAVDARENDMYPGDGIYVAGFIALALLVTVVLGASIRSARMRTALRPVEVGALVGVATWLATLLFPDDDPYSGQEYLAVGIGIFAMLGWAFIAALVQGRQRERTWLLGTLGVLMVIGFALPPLDRWLADIDAGAYAQEFGSDSSFATAFGQDGSFSLSGSRIYGYTAAIEAGYEPQASNEAGPYYYDDPSGPVDANGATMSTFGDIPPFGGVELRVLDDDTLRLDARPNGAADGSRLQAEIRRGTCGAPGAVVGGRFDITVGALTRTATGITLADLATNRELVLVAGSGDPLAPVRCIDLVDRGALAAAQLGAASFGKRCIAPLGIDATALRRITVSSFQDARCGEDWVKLARIASARYVSDGAATQVRDCLAGISLDDSLVRDLPGNEALLDLGNPDLDPRALQCADIAMTPAMAVPAPSQDPNVA